MHMRRWLLGACLAVVAATGLNCGKDEEKPPPTPLGNGTIGTIRPAAHGDAFSAPLDAIPNPDGTAIYFTARNAAGAGVFQVNLSSGVTTALYAGDLIAGPMGLTVSSDDKTIFIADPASAAGEDDDRGAIWTVPTAGGTPTLLAGTAGYAPRGITLVNENGTDQLYFTGRTPDQEIPGVFKVAASGGTVEGIAKGYPFQDPSGIVVTGLGDIYVMDTAAQDVGSGSARIISIVDQAVNVFQSGFKVGFPAGIAVSQDDTALLVSARNPDTGANVVGRLEITTKTHTPYTSTLGNYEEAAGLHRAAKAEVYAFVDSSADGTGTVFILTE